MTARRQGSRTSLDQYARPGANSPSKNHQNGAEFCNSFWGHGDAGVDVLLTRLRGAMRTVEELKSYFKERYAIEEEYAKRLTNLSTMTLGRDEIGETREALDAIRLETGRQAGFHMTLAQSIRNDLEIPTAAFYSRQLELKTHSQATVEHEFRAKQMQEGKVLDKYEQERDQTKGREFPGFARAYGDTARKWERIWKDFCDQAQDIEEERLDFIKESLWAYANAISTVCVADDEACEIWRTLLEQVEIDRDMENFIRDYGTGNQIPDAMAFLRYKTSDGGPSSSSSSSSDLPARTAQFKRVSRRGPPASQAPASPEPEVGGSSARSPQAAESSRQMNGTPTSVASPGPSSSRKSLSIDLNRDKPLPPSAPSSSSRPLGRHDTLTHQIDEFQKVVDAGPSLMDSPPTSPSPAGRNVSEISSGPARSATASSTTPSVVKTAPTEQIVASPIDAFSRGSPQQQSPRTPNSGHGSIPKSHTVSSSGSTGGGGSGSISPNVATSPSSNLAPRLHDDSAEPPATPLSGHYNIPPPPQQPPPTPSQAQRRSWSSAPAPPPSAPIPNLPGPPPPLPPAHQQPAQQQSYTLIDPPYNPPAPHSPYHHSPVQPAYQQQQPVQQANAYLNGGRSPTAASFFSATAPVPAPRAPSPQPRAAPPPQPQAQQQQYLPQPQQQNRPPPLSVQVTAPGDTEDALGTGQVTEEGNPILFYVQAIYDYTATIEEEFDFTTGDIIAVTATPEDGWWSGELLDENRRQKGRNVFPSNFVSLLE